MTKISKKIDSPWTVNANVLKIVSENPLKPALTTAQRWKKISKAKFLQNAILRPLEILNSPVQTDYKKAIFCRHNLKWSFDLETYTGKRCRKRICKFCQNYKTLQQIEKYVPVLSQLTDLYLVTLTIKNIPGEQLKKAIEQMQSNFRKLTRLASKHGIDYNTIRRLEITYNPITNEYHPHFHILVQYEKTAQFIYDTWFRYYDNKLSHKGNDIRPADTNSLKELFKYAMKVIHRDKTTTKNIYQVYPIAIDTMYQAIKGIRTIQPTGDFRNIIEPDKDEDSENSESADLKTTFVGNELTWFQDIATYVNENGEQVYPNEFNAKIKIIVK